MPICPLTVHWDGKAMRKFSSKCKEERLAVYVTGEKVEKQLGIPKIRNGTGEAQASAVFQLINEWKISENIEFLSFDTTAANTGIRNGACQLIAKKMKKPLIWLACRHHVFELIVACAFSATVEKNTLGPEIVIFQKFQKNWIQMDKNKYQRPKWHE